MTSRSRSASLEIAEGSRGFYLQLSYLQCPRIGEEIKGDWSIPPPLLLCHVCLAVRVVQDGGRTDRMTREEVCEREQVPKRSSIATGGSTSGPITSWYSRIKSRIVIPYSFVYHNTIHRRWILADVSHYSGGIIIPLCESARDRDSTLMLSSCLPSFSSLLPIFRGPLSRMSESTWICGILVPGEPGIVEIIGAVLEKRTRKQELACFRGDFDMNAAVIAISLEADALDNPRLLSQELRNTVSILWRLGEN